MQNNGITPGFKLSVITFLQVFLVILKVVSQGIPIPANFLGQNAWLTNSIGGHVIAPGYNIPWSDVNFSGAKMIRFGGNHADKYADPEFVSDYLRMIDNARENGCDVILQVPYYDKNEQFTDYNKAADQAAEFVNLINNTYKKHVRYFSIGNEPWMPDPKHIGYLNYNEYHERNGRAAGIISYTKKVSQKMKETQMGFLPNEPIKIVV